MKNLSQDKRKLILFAAGYLLLMGVITVLLLPFIGELMKPEVRAQFQAWVNSLGFGGVALMFTIQVLQIIIAFIPGEPIELAAGALYGGFGGFLICILGCLLAHTVAFSLSRRFGAPLLERAFGKEKMAEFAFLKNAKRLETIVFLLFLIPGTPKDILTYIVGISPMRLGTFVAVSIFARIPSILSSTLIGANLWTGDWGAAIAIFAVVAAVGLVGIRYKDRAMKKVRELAAGGKN